MKAINRTTAAVIAGCVFCVVTTGGRAEGIIPVPTADPSRIGAVIEQLSSIQSRVSGTDGNHLAGAFVEAMFRDIGLENVRSEEFEVVIPEDDGAYLEMPNGERVRLYCVWPNYTRTSKVTDEGIRGELIYGGDGEVKELNGKPVEGSIVLMEFVSSTRWLDAAMLGAEAIVFIEPKEKTTQREAEKKFLAIPIDIPRFWLPRDELAKVVSLIRANDAALEERGLLDSLGKTRSLKVRLLADMNWRQSTSRNIFGDVIGTDRQLRGETIIIESYYDSMSVVPALAPGAEQACGMAGLLELARYFVAHPPKRTIRFMATGGHWTTLSGVREWIAKHYYRDEKQQRQDWPESYEVFFGLDLSSATKDVGLFCRGFFYEQRLGSDLMDENQVAKRFFDFSRAFELYVEALPPEGKEATYIDGIRPPTGKKWRAFLPSLVCFDSEAYTLVGKEGMTFATANDPREVIDTPLDRREKVNAENVAAQVRLIGALLHMAGDDPEFSFGRSRQTENFATAFAEVVDDQLVGGYVPLKPLPNVLIAYAVINSTSAQRRKTTGGVRGTAYTFTNKDGLFELRGIHRMWYWVRPAHTLIGAFLFDPKDGSITHTINEMGEKGHEKVVLEGRQVERPLSWLKRKTDKRIPVFKCVATAIYDMFDQRFLSTLASDKIDLLDGDSNSQLTRARHHRGGKDQWTSYSEPCAVFFTERDTKLKALIYSGSRAQARVRMTLINASPEDPEGLGYLASERENKILRSGFEAAKDMWVIDDYRIKEMERYGVKNLRVSELHSLAKGALDDAESKLEVKDYDGFLRGAREAWALESRAYPEVRKTQNDVVKGVVFYFVLLIPFVFFLERLFFGFADIRKQLGAMFGIFAVVYAILDRIHPAFRLSKAPILVVLSFFIMSTGIIVILFLLSKFSEHMEKLRARTAIIHRADVGRLSSAAAAFSLGVSNMKKRKIRTTLTCATLSLLGFTVISFVSFSNITKLNRRQTLREPLYQGALLRSGGWRGIEEYALGAISHDFRDKTRAIIPRCWIQSNERLELYTHITRADDVDKSFTAYAIAGLDPREPEATKVDKTLAYGSWLAPGAKDDCIINTTMAESLEVTPENYASVSLTVYGKRYRIAGVVDTFKFSWWAVGEGVSGSDGPDRDCGADSVQHDAWCGLREG